jgi:predicted nucleic acid-binding protein
MNYYIDSCIWRDFLENRSDGLKPLGEFAYLFFKKCLKENHKIYFSNLVFDELSKYVGENEVNNLINNFSNIIIIVNYSNVQILKAKNLIKKYDNLHFADSLHIIIAKENKCAIITRDKHFFNLGELIKVFEPEEVI